MRRTGTENEKAEKKRDSDDPELDNIWYNQWSALGVQIPSFLGSILQQEKV